MEVYEKKSYDVKFFPEELQFMRELADFCEGLMCSECPWYSFCRAETNKGTFSIVKFFDKLIKENEKRGI